MRRFNIIKKSRKKSKDIDEKIQYLNKECKKTGLHEIANSTTGLYQGSSINPNEKYVEFTAITCNGYPFGISGDANLGQQSVGGAMIRADGAALSPPHPITGERTVGMTKGDISQGMKIAIPGDRPTPQSRMTGPILWWFDPSYNFAGAQGRWMQMEYSSPSVHGNGVYPSYQAGWGYWGTGFLGFALLRDDEEYQHVFDCLKDSNGDQFNPDEITVPTTIVFFQNDLGDPTHLPIDVRRFGFSPEAYDYLKNAAGLDIASGEPDLDTYDWYLKTYPNSGAAQWYYNNPSSNPKNNPFLPINAYTPFTDTASNPNDSGYSDVVSDVDVNIGLGAQPGDQLAFFGGGKNNNKPPSPPTSRTNKGTLDATKASTGMYPNMTPEIFFQKYGITPNQYLNLP